MAALIGALIAIAAAMLFRAIGMMPADNNTLGYWIGVGLFGAMVGAVIAINSKR